MKAELTLVESETQKEHTTDFKVKTVKELVVAMRVAVKLANHKTKKLHHAVVRFPDIQDIEIEQI